MILFITLICTLLALVAFLVLAVSIGGAVTIVMFGDVIVCAVLIVLLIKWLMRKKKK